MDDDINESKATMYSFDKVLKRFPLYVKTAMGYKYNMCLRKRLCVLINFGLILREKLHMFFFNLKRLIIFFWSQTCLQL